MLGHFIPHQDELAELALKRVVASGADYGDIRLLDSTTQTIRGEDRRIASIRDAQDSGFGIREPQKAQRLSASPLRCDHSRSEGSQ